MPITRLLLIEDDESLGFVIQDNLRRKGYDVTWCKDGNEGLTQFKNLAPQVCILDIMLIGKDGFEVARQIRQADQATPLLFLTAKSLIEDKLKAFQIGADDYITKPFHMEELVYRIEIALRRSEGNSLREVAGILALGDYEFDTDKLLLIHSTGSQALTFKEAELLKVLYTNRDRILKREEILNHVWGNDDYFNGRSMDVFISKLRKYLKADDSIQIVNYHGVGFRLEGNW